MSVSGGVFILQQIYNRIISNQWTNSLLNVRSIVNNLSVINEGDSVVISANTSYAENQTLYWTIQSVTGTVDSNDLSSISGSFVVQSNNYGYFTITSLEDLTTEGEESFYVQIRKDSISGEILINSGTITINDTSSGPTYSISANTTSVDEGNTVSFTVTTTNVPNNTTLYYNTSQITGTVDSSDFSDATLSGSFIVNDNTAFFERTLNNDLNTEGSESFAITIRSGSITGSILATSETVTINDTSFFSSLQFGWFAGGYQGSPSPAVLLSSIDRISFSSDTESLSSRGKLSIARSFSGSTRNLDYGWFGAGWSGGFTPNNVYSTVDRLDYSSDTTNAISRTNVGQIKWGLTSEGNSDYGWFIAGFVPGGTTHPGPSNLATSRVTRITYSSDTSAASTRGPAGGTLYGLSASGNENYAWMAGGVNTPSPASFSLVRRITYATDTGVTTTVGSLSAARQRMAVSTNDSYGWFSGGWSPTLPAGTSLVDRIDYSNDTPVASVRGPLTAVFWSHTAVSDKTNGYGWHAGGRLGAPTTVKTNIARIDFNDDTVTALQRNFFSTSRELVTSK